MKEVIGTVVSVGKLYLGETVWTSGGRQIGSGGCGALTPPRNLCYLHHHTVIACLEPSVYIHQSQRAVPSRLQH